MKKTLLFGLLVLFITQVAFGQGSIPRPDYPRPQFERSAWINLNGSWSYTFDFGVSGMDRKLFESKGFGKRIIVPFCPESKLSAVQYTDFINAMWYHRHIQIPSDWSGKKILLHFGAVDYYAAIYIDGQLVGRHWGGSSSFEIDITGKVKPGTNHDLVVQVEDDQRSGKQARGKQSGNYYSQGCDYTRTTGIWQTVWMEAVDNYGLQSAYIIPELDQQRFIVYPKFHALSAGQKLRINVKEAEKVVNTIVVQAADPSYAVIPLKTIRTWSPESPFLYDFEFEVLNEKNEVIDYVKSYAGMRKIHTEGNRYFLNNQPYYLRLVLDQGFYQAGIWTAPSDADLKRDIEMSMAAGFNGARLHQKVFEERFHYWADKLGYLTWGESANWGADANNVEAARNFISEWREIVVRDRNHPSIIAWTPFNETWERSDNNHQARQHDRLVTDVYHFTHDLDYRPVNDASGNFHVITDLFTIHNYEQKPEKLKEILTVKEGVYYQQNRNKEMIYEGKQPYMIDEYGGIKWVVGKQFAENTWGYGEGPKTEEEFYTRLRDLTDVILDASHISGYCYTQLTDVEQEQNGIYNYNRTSKFDMSQIKPIFSKTPPGYANSAK